MNIIGQNSADCLLSFELETYGTLYYSTYIHEDREKIFQGQKCAFFDESKEKKLLFGKYNLDQNNIRDGLC